MSFQTSLFGCLGDLGICLYGIFCFECLAAQNWANVREEQCSCYHLCCFASPFWTRQDLRKKKGMSTAYLGDCLTYLLCYPCAVCQDARELKS